jgi:hypothetical protein
MQRGSGHQDRYAYFLTHMRCLLTWHKVLCCNNVREEEVNGHDLSHTVIFTLSFLKVNLGLILLISSLFFSNIHTCVCTVIYAVWK